MPAPTRKTILAEQHIERAIEHLPFYVVEFVRAKKRARLSPGTISGYLHDYKKFFDWLRTEGLTNIESNADIPFAVLETLRKKDVEYFVEMIMEEKIEKRKDVFVTRSEASASRFIQSLKSLFNYLTTESENDEGECYFYRNVFAKIKTPKKSESIARRAKRISSQILDKNEMDGLLNFVKYDYEKELSPRQLSRFYRDRIRDVAIISLFQGSGIRVNELAGLQVTDVDYRKGDINALRKGNKLDTVSITPSAMKDLKKYLDERDVLYKPDPKNLFVFLTKYAGQANPIAVETIQKLIGKYSQAFLLGKRLSPHKLRHSFSKKWLDEGGSLVGLRDQLGHNTIETTVLYTNLSQEEQREILKKMDKSSGN
ncbi:MULTISPECIES: tyrosine recombinase XerS [unclassified Sporosarcina]|uniref:tyrosine recombinase XerS n=1 Tax=unclassified Sporosarcina TaxID=2647733 RepID=UPI001A911FC6|nr:MULTISPECIES: tyrosine recombinase XerS [unclassified Sporosarcina]MBO0588361.1 tyrosine recombinase XerS [Sporosarcina sp. E16_8]MBO0603632.1 tyrosine recombinase XerS [Sporosarcina sp. E16_3]